MVSELFIFNYFKYYYFQNNNSKHKKIRYFLPEFKYKGKKNS